MSSSQDEYVRWSNVSCMCMGVGDICMQSSRSQTCGCSHRLGGFWGLPQMCLQMHHWPLSISTWCPCLQSTWYLHIFLDLQKLAQLGALMRASLLHNGKTFLHTYACSPSLITIVLLLCVTCISDANNTLTALTFTAVKKNSFYMCCCPLHFIFFNNNKNLRVAAFFIFTAVHTHNHRLSSLGFYLLLRCLCNLHCGCLLFHHTDVCPYTNSLLSITCT